MLEGTTVEGDAHVDLVCRGAICEVELDGLVRRDIGAGTTVQVSFEVDVSRGSFC